MISLSSSLAASTLLFLNVATASIQGTQPGLVVEVSIINTIVASPETGVSKKLDLRAEPTITIANADAPAVYMGKTLSSGGPVATIDSSSAVVGYGSDGIVVQYPGGIVSIIKVEVAAPSVEANGGSGAIASAIDGIANGKANDLVPSTTSTTSSAAASSSSGSGFMETCIEGTGEGNFEGLCSYSCHYGYCPNAVCSCTSYGEAVEPPATTGLDGEPAPGEGAGYIGLCSFACSRGYCPEGACISKASGNGNSNATSSVVASSTTSSASSSSSSSSSGSACIEGTGEENFEGLCSFTCHYGYCPPGVCTCTSFGDKVPSPPTSNPNGVPLPGLSAGYLGLCSFACNHGYCPDTACTTSGDSGNSSSSISSTFSNGTSTISSTTTPSSSSSLSTTISTISSTVAVISPSITPNPVDSEASKNVMVWSLIVLAFAAFVVR